MKNWSKLIMAGMAIMFCVIVTSACKPKSEQTVKQEETKAPATAKLEVSFKVVPEQPVSNMAPTLQATVMQNDKAVTDATVELEVWKEGMDKQRIKASHSKEGIYTAEPTLKDAGDYQVTVHVTTPSGMQQDKNGNFTVKKKENVVKIIKS